MELELGAEADSLNYMAHCRMDSEEEEILVAVDCEEARTYEFFRSTFFIGFYADIFRYYPFVNRDIRMDKMSNVTPENQNPYGLNPSSAEPVSSDINLGKPQDQPPVYGEPYTAPPQYGYPQQPDTNYYQPQQPQYGQSYGYDAYGQQPAYGYGYPAAPASPMAPVSMGLGIFALLFNLILGPFNLLFSVPAVILGHLALKKIKLTGQKGKGFAVAGLATGYVAIGLAVISIILIIFAVAVCAGDPTISSSCSSFV